MSEHMTEEKEVRGALAAIKEVATRERRISEFRTPTLDFNLAERTPITMTWDEGIRTIVELRIGASYMTFQGDKEHQAARDSAYRSLTTFLYRDVLDDLRTIIQAVGDGERHKAMDLLGGLCGRLRGD